MLTTQQINNFRTWAKQQGFNEQQIAQEIARKNQELTRQTVQPTKTTQVSPMPSTPVVPTSVQQRASIQPMASVQPPAPQQPKTLTGAVESGVGKVANFLIPRISKVARTVTSTFDLDKQTESYTKAQAELHNKSMALIQQAKRETDPQRRAELLEQSREIDRVALTNTENFTAKMDEFKAKTGVREDQSNLKYALGQGIGVAGEAASWIVPVGKVVPAARLIRGTGVVSKILKAGIEGGAVGAVYNATDPNAESWEERINNAMKGFGVGAVTGGALGATGQVAKIPTKILKDFVKGNSDRIDRLFRITPQERIQFRKSTGNMNFAEEILKRDGRELAGKSYEELISHFENRIDEAYNAVENVTKNSKSMIETETLKNKIKSMLVGLEPGKGNVGMTNSKNALEGLLADLEQNPNQLTMSMANRIKRQLQDLGDSAFDANGNPTPQSKQIAEVSTYLKGLIEGVLPETKELNKTVQLYHQAKRAIERTGAREANKISNDVGGKFLQAIPVAVPAALGVGGTLAGGPLGGIAGALVGAITSGGVGALRVKYFSPEFQTKLIKMLEGAAQKNGLKNPTKVAGKIVSELGTIIRKSGEMKAASAVAGASRETPASFETEVPTQASQMTEEQKGLLEEMMPQSEGSLNDQFAAQQSQADPNEMVEITNDQTGETKTIPRSQLSQYGIQDPDMPEQSSGSAIPTKKDILVAMMIDLQQTGGKNMAKLNALMTAYDSVFGMEEKLAYEKAKQELEGGGEAKLELSDSAVKSVNDIKGAISDVTELKKAISESDLIGPVKGLSAKSPYASESRSLQAEIDRVRQVVGKALEGGVLRKEDEEKYKKILPTMRDTKEVALSKLEQLEEKLNADLESYVSLQREYGKGRGAENILNSQQMTTDY